MSRCRLSHGLCHLGSARDLLALAIFLGLMTGPLTALAATFTGLGDLPGGGFSSRAQSVSYDGSVVVGYSESSYPAEAFRWSAAGGMEGLGVIGSPGTESHAYGVSADGSVIAGDSDGRAARWEEGTGAYLPNNGNFAPEVARAVSPDGTHIVGDGLLYEEMWQFLGFHFDGTATQPLEPLSEFAVGGNSSAFGTNADGSLIVGYSADSPWLTTRGTRWVNGSPQILTYTGQAEPHDVTPGGTAVVGADPVVLDVPSCRMHAFRLDQQGLIDLGRPHGNNVSLARSVSDAGDAIVGSSWRCELDDYMTSYFFETAFLWRQGRGIDHVRRVLTIGMGLPLTGWFLEAATAISGDGTTVVGYGRNPSGQVEGWRAQATAEEWEAAMLAVQGSALPTLTPTGTALQVVATLVAGVALLRGRRVRWGRDPSRHASA